MLTFDFDWKFVLMLEILSQIKLTSTQHLKTNSYYLEAAMWLTHPTNLSIIATWYLLSLKCTCAISPCSTITTQECSIMITHEHFCSTVAFYSSTPSTGHSSTSLAMCSITCSPLKSPSTWADIWCRMIANQQLTLVHLKGQLWQVQQMPIHLLA